MIFIELYYNGELRHNEYQENSYQKMINFKCFMIKWSR